MSKKLKILLFAVLFLVPGMLQAQESFEDDALVIDLATGLYGADLQVGDLNLPESFPAQIDSANTGRYDVFIEVAHDPTGWKLLQWLAQNEQLLKLEEFRIQWNILQQCADQSINLARESSIRRLLDKMGLKSKRVFVRSKKADSPYIKVYAEECAWVKPVHDNRQRLGYLEHDYAVMSGELEGFKKNASNKISQWRLMIGSEGITVTNGKPVIVPVLSLEVFRGNFLLSTTGGYLPSGETDQKFAAVSLLYFPGGHKLGLMARGIYASETIDLGYIQQGYGPMFGLTFHNSWLNCHLTGGIQYFDRQGEERHVEPTINLGMKLRALSF